MRFLVRSSPTRTTFKSRQGADVSKEHDAGGFQTVDFIDQEALVSFINYYRGSVTIIATGNTLFPLMIFSNKEFRPSPEHKIANLRNKEVSDGKEA